MKTSSYKIEHVNSADQTRNQFTLQTVIFFGNIIAVTGLIVKRESDFMLMKPPGVRVLNRILIWPHFGITGHPA